MHDPTPASLEKWKHLADEQKRIYAAVITDGDNAVGKVLAALDKAGIAQDKPKADRSMPFVRWDTNHDGFLTLDEYKPGLKTGENLEETLQEIRQER